MRPGQRQLLAFGVTHGGKSLLWAGSDALFLYTLIEILEISPPLAGGLFILASFCNALLDGLWGRTLSRTPTLQAGVPAIGAGAAVLACAMFALLPMLRPDAALAAGLVLVAFRCAFSLLDVPHNAVAAVLAGTHGHLAVARWRTAIGAGAALVVAATAIPLLMANAAGTGTAKWLLVALGGGALVMLAPLPWLLATVPREAMRSAAPARPGTDAARRRDLLRFCLVQMVGFAALASVGKAILHLDIAGTGVMANALLLIAALRLASIWIWPPLTARLPLSASLAVAYLATGVAVLLLPVGIGHGDIAALAVLSAYGVAVGGVILMVWSRFSELLAQLDLAADRGAAAYGYSLFTATTKIGLGLSGLMTGLWIADHAPPLDASNLSNLALIVATLCAACAALGWRGRREASHAGAPSPIPRT